MAPEIHHTELADDLDLVLVGSNLPHGWFNSGDSCTGVREVTIQFHRDLFDDKLFKRNQLSFIRTLLERSAKGILFSAETAAAKCPRLEKLTQKNGFDSVLELLSILHDLSTARHMGTLSNTTFSSEHINFNSRRIEQIFAYMNEHYDKGISLADVSKLVNMDEVSFNRHFKSRTGKTFIESLNEILLGQVSRLLIDITQTISKIAYQCGFSNLSYFNRILRSKNGCPPPREFRQNYSGTRMFI